MVAYGSFDHEVFQRELHWYFAHQNEAAAWLNAVRWTNAMEPYAVFKGLQSASRGAYRYQKLGGPRHATARAWLVFERLEQVAATVPAPRTW